MRMKFSNWWEIEETLIKRKLYKRAIIALWVYISNYAWH